MTTHSSPLTSISSTKSKSSNSNSQPSQTKMPITQPMSPQPTSPQHRISSSPTLPYQPVKTPPANFKRPSLLLSPCTHPSPLPLPPLATPPSVSQSSSRPHVQPAPNVAVISSLKIKRNTPSAASARPKKRPKTSTANTPADNSSRSPPDQLTAKLKSTPQTDKQPPKKLTPTITTKKPVKKQAQTTSQKKPAPSVIPFTPAAKKPPTATGEYDLNDPTLWGSLFGGLEKKVVEKPVKPGNLPRTNNYPGGTTFERLTARSKQRTEEKRILELQRRQGFDLLRQSTEMMDFEIDYKTKVRAMADWPLPYDTVINRTSSPPPAEALHHQHPPSLSTSSPRTGPSLIQHRPDGYKLYTQPPPPPPNQQTQLQSQPPGPTYVSTSGSMQKVLPRPGLFGSSFFIWQRAHLPP